MGGNGVSITATTKYTCNCCGLKYDDAGRANGCYREHERTCTAALPRYAIGQTVRYHQQLGQGYTREIDGTLIRTRGVLWKLELLIEDADGEREWTNVIWQDVLLWRENDFHVKVEVVA